MRTPSNAQAPPPASRRIVGRGQAAPGRISDIQPHKEVPGKPSNFGAAIRTPTYGTSTNINNSATDTELRRVLDSDPHRDLEAPHGVFLAARSEDSNELLAFAGERLRFVSLATSELKRMCVRPAARGAGIGRALVMAAEGAPRDLGALSMILEPTPSSMKRAGCTLRTASRKLLRTERPMATRSVGMERPSANGVLQPTNEGSARNSHEGTRAPRWLTGSARADCDSREIPTAPVSTGRAQAAASQLCITSFCAWRSCHR
jgi:GNAT superfamily N-acetyltransferase